MATVSVTGIGSIALLIKGVLLEQSQGVKENQWLAVTKNPPSPINTSGGFYVQSMVGDGGLDPPTFCV